uniref:Putative heparin sulfate cell surface proteoglycan n=1 Tax=Xenopsylla cheopis TaxID=163159 RepID=A0A6M2DPX6_XENCH
MIICKFLVISVCISFVLSANLYNSDRTEECDKTAALLHAMHIVPDKENNSKGALCESVCCSPSTEEILLRRTADDYVGLLKHNSGVLQGLLDSTAATLKEHILTVIGQSENRTLALLDTVYRRPPRLGHPPVTALYDSIRKHISSFNNAEVKEISDVTTIPASTSHPLDKAVRQFFERLFPLAYHHIAHFGLTDFTEEYKQCLMENYDEIQPFSDAAKRLSSSLRRSLQATRLLLHALVEGRNILQDIDETLSVEQDKECLKAMTKMTYCSKCNGLKASRPCAGFCLNVLRGCLAARVDGLDAPWNSYLEALQSLASAARAREPEELHMERVLGDLDNKVSQAIMSAMEAGPELKTRVRKVCGHSIVLEEEATSQAATGSGEITTVSPQQMYVKQMPLSSPAPPPPPPDAELLQSLAAAHESRALYARIADTLCRDEAYAETSDGSKHHCWNGQGISEYTQTVVDASATAQRYNPEFGIRQVQDDPQYPKIARLADRLRRVTSDALSGLRNEGAFGAGSLGGNPGDLAMADMAPDGSGSGRGDSEYDEVFEEGSGSGDGSDEHSNGSVKINEVTPTHPNDVLSVAGSSHIVPTLCVTLMAWMLAVNVHHVR